MVYRFEQFIEQSYDKVFVSSLANVILKIDQTSTDIGSKEDLPSCLHNFILVLLTSDILDQDKTVSIPDSLGFPSQCDGLWGINFVCTIFKVVLRQTLVTYYSLINRARGPYEEIFV